MRLNTITCLSYAVAGESATITLASTDLDEIKALTSAERLMLFDDSGNPLYELVGFDRIVSIKLLPESNSAEVLFGRTDSAVKALQGESQALNEQIGTLEGVLKNATDLSSLLFVNLAQSGTLDDTTVSEHPELFVVWDENWTGKTGAIVLDDGYLYRSLHDVGAGQNTKPSRTPSMWRKVGAPEEEIPVWSQPLGGHDAYAAGDVVTHNEKVWQSTVDSNVWEPGVYGWNEVKED